MFPTPMLLDGVDKHKVKAFDLGDNITIILLDNGDLFWAGLRLAYKPERLRIPKDVKPKLVGASHKSVAVVSEDNHIYMKD